MKRIHIFMFVMMMVLMISACGKDNNPLNSGNETGSASWTAEKHSKQDGKKKILVAYFSWADNAVQDDIDAMTSPSVKVPGNVAQLASWVSGETGGDLFSIQVNEPYPSGWDDCLDRANQEKGDGTHPALKAKVENLQDYDTVYLGFPNWWYSCPMAIFSFLEENDLSGKQVYLFCSHGT